MEAAFLPNDPGKLKAMLVAQSEQLAARESLLADKESQLADKDAVIEEQAERIRLFEAIIFAKRSEMRKKPGAYEQQYSLFNEAELVSEQPQEESEPEVVRVPEHTRKKKGRKPISDQIPREEIVHDIPEAEKMCACGHELSRIGEVVSEKLDYVPARLRVLRHIRPKYACRRCEGTEDDGPTVKVAPMSSHLIKQGIVTSGLLANIIVSKFCDGLPFYRQSNMFGRLGVEIARSTMSNWAMLAAEKCEPLLELMYTRLRGGDIINLDETPVQVLKEPGRENTAKSYMWVARGGGERPVVLFRYAPSRAGEIAAEIVGDFKGYLQTDGYIGYKALGERPDITHVGCLVHVRRKFMGVLKAGAKKKKGTATTVVNLIAKLYHIESQARKQGKSLEELHEIRAEKIRPILDQIHKDMTAAEGTVPPSSLLGKAVSYGLGQWPRILAYLAYPRLRPDNNVAENAIRPFAIGRKNWLFAGSPRGADASALFYSLIETAKANGLNPVQYLYDLFERLPLAKTPEDLQALMPWAISMNSQEE